MSGHVADAVACFRRLNSESAQEITDEQANWILGE